MQIFTNRIINEDVENILRENLDWNYFAGKTVRVIDMHNVKLVDRTAIIEAAKTAKILVAQDNNIIGRLGCIVATVISEEGLSIKFRNVGIPDKFVAMAHAPYLYHEFGYDVERLERTMIELLER